MHRDLGEAHRNGRLVEHGPELEVALFERVRVAVGYYVEAAERRGARLQRTLGDDP